MRSHAPFEPIVTKFCTWGRVVDLITVKFYGNRFRGFGVTGPPPQTPFPILNVHRPHNSVSTIYRAALWCRICKANALKIPCFRFPSVKNLRRRQRGDRLMARLQRSASGRLSSRRFWSTHLLQGRPGRWLCVEAHFRATERYLPYGITQCYLPPDTCERAPP